MKPADFKKQHNGQRFQVRRLGHEWQVYANGLTHIALCSRPEIADMIANSLETVAENHAQKTHVPEG